MKYSQNRRLPKVASVRETRKVKQVRIPQLAVTFISRPKPNGRDIAIYCRLTYNGQRLPFTTGINCKRKDFNTATLTIQGQPEQTALLTTIKANAFKAYARLRTGGYRIDLETVKKMTLGHILTDTKTPTLIQAFALFLERSEKEYRAGTIDFETYRQHERWAMRIGEYFTVRYGKDCILTDVRPSDAKDLQLALQIESSHGQNYSLKIVQHAKRILNFGLENLWIQRNPFLNFRGNRKPPKIEYVTEKELTLLAKTTNLNPALQRVLDVFLWQIYTGYAWKDAEQLTPANILIDHETGGRFIQKDRQKSGQPQPVPLIPQAEVLLSKYAKDPVCVAKGRLLPVVANQTMNSHLKAIAAIVGIEKNLTTHVARKTFITLLHGKGMGLKVLSVMAGHTNTAMTEKHYLKVTPGQLIREMKKIYPDMKTPNNDLNEQAA